MSLEADSSIITGSIDSFDLEFVSIGTYWFKLTHFPILNSIITNFEFSNSTIVSESEIIMITDNRNEYIDGIHYISYDSIDSDEYSKCLIGTTIIDNDKSIKIDNNNYLKYKKLMIDYVFIDFSRSEQICSILDSLDSSGNRECNNLSVTYFYEV